MKKVYTDAELRQILGADREDSTIIDRKMQAAYEEVRRRSNHNKITDINTGKRKEAGAKSDRMPGKRSGRILRRAAAAFVLAMIFCAANPALAEEFPVLGSIFNTMQGLVTFGGVPEDEISIFRKRRTQMRTKRRISEIPMVQQSDR